MEIVALRNSPPKPPKPIWLRNYFHQRGGRGPSFYDVIENCKCNCKIGEYGTRFYDMMKYCKDYRAWNHFFTSWWSIVKISDARNRFWFIFELRVRAKDIVNKSRKSEDCKVMTNNAVFYPWHAAWTWLLCKTLQDFWLGYLSISKYLSHITSFQIPFCKTWGVHGTIFRQRDLLVLLHNYLHFMISFPSLFVSPHRCYSSHTIPYTYPCTHPLPPPLT